MKSTRNLAAWIVIGLLCIGLMGFGTQQFSSGVRSIGSAGDKEIAVQDYANALQGEQRRLSAQTGQTVTFQQMQQFGLDRTALAQLVGRRVIENEAAEQGLSVGDEAVRDAIVSSGQFAQINGSFSRDVYTETLRRNGTSEAEYETAIRENQAATLLQDAILAGTPHVDGFTDAITSYNRATRDFSWIEITSSPTAGEAPTQEQLRAFYEDNLDLFMAPETRAITAARLTPDMIMDKVELDETALRALYDERIAGYQQPERRLVERLVFADADAAQAAADQLTAGETTFEALVEARGLNLSDIDLGDVDKAALGAAGYAAFAAETDSVVGPFNSRVGPALYRVNGVIDAVTTTFDDALPELREELAGNRAIRMIDDQRGQIDDMIAGGARIEDLTNQTDMELEAAEWTADSVDGLFAYESITTAMPELTVGDLPKLIELEDGGLAALRLDSVTEAAAKPFEQVAGDVDAAWRRAQDVTNARTHAQDLAQQLRDGADFAALGLEPTAETALTRGGFVADAPTDVISVAFETADGDYTVIDTATGAVILGVTGTDLPAEDDETVALRTGVSDALAQGINQDIFAAFAIAVQARTDVSLNDAAINAVHAQMQ